MRNLGCDSLLPLLPYEKKVFVLDLPPLDERRFILGVSFLSKFINYTTDSPPPSGEINFNVPSRSFKNFIFIKLSQFRYNYELVTYLGAFAKI